MEAEECTLLRCSKHVLSDDLIVLLCVSGNTSWSKDDDLPWLRRPVSRQSDTDYNHHSDGPSSPSSRPPPASWVDPDTVVPPPERVGRRLVGQTSTDVRPTDNDGDGSLSRLTQSAAAAAAAGRRRTDKFDELDEETMSPLNWPSEPATVIATSY